LIKQHPSATGIVATLVWLAAAGGVHAQYKVVGPDGSITYTDRPPLTSNVKVTPIGRSAQRGVTSAEVGLPLDLRQAAQRHPVTLYTSTNCQPCDSGRRLLQQRGVPYSEKTVTTEDDARALERIVGGLTVPAVTIGAQPLRGYSEQDWSAYLDAAGYPKENKLPRGWPTPQATALVERAAPVARAPAPPPPPPAAATEPAESTPGTPSTIRF
jgi:glutaredoxin